MARGKAARNEVPRSSHARWVPVEDRADPVALLEEQGASRVPELVPVGSEIVCCRAPTWSDRHGLPLKRMPDPLQVAANQDLAAHHIGIH